VPDVDTARESLASVTERLERTMLRASSFAEDCAVLRERLAALHGYLDSLTREELDRPIEAHVGTVAGGLGVIFTELTAHDRFINRDLDSIQKSRA
jgi:hypothetical protein